MFNRLLSSLDESSKATTSEITGIQYLRAVAALGVVLVHSDGMTALPHYFGTKTPWASGFGGEVGVQLFFVISGFIITVVALKHDLQPKVSPAEFFVRRFARIVPLLWVAVISYVALRALGRGTIDYLDAVQSFFLWPVGSLDQPNVVWTLRQEADFYIVFAATFLTAKWARGFLVLWLLAPVLLQWWLPYDEPSRAGLGVEALTHFLHPVNILFGTGMLIGAWWHKAGRHVQATLPMSAFPLAVVAFVGLAFLGGALGFTTRSVPSVCLTAILCGLLVVAACILRDRRPSRLGLLLGSASYAIYLFHPHLLSAQLGVLAKFAPQLPTTVVILVTTVFATLGAIVIHLLIEKPLIRFTRAAFRVEHTQGSPART